MAETPKMTELGEELLHWQFPEYPDRQRSIGAWMWLLLAGIALLIGAIWSNNFLFAVIIVLVAIIYILQSRIRPRLIDFHLLEDGIQVGKDQYRYSDIDRFWIVYKPGEIQAIYFHFKSTVRPYLAVPLGEANPLRVRDILRRYLYEDLEKEEEPVTEEIARHLKV